MQGLWFHQCVSSTSKFYSIHENSQIAIFRMRQISYRGFSRKTKRSKPDPLISGSAI